jgi:hypothetical protein
MLVFDMAPVCAVLHGTTRATRQRVTGSAAGIVGALASAPLLSSLLHGVDPSDRSMLAMAPVVLMSIGTLAAGLASARVLWVAPAETLRAE